MPQVRVGWRPYVDSGLDVSATAFSNAAGITDSTQRAAIDTLVKDLKRFNIWSKIKAFYPFVGGTANSHKFNLVDPRDLNEAYRLAFSGGWTHSSMGIKGNANNTWADTFLSLRTVFGSTSTEHTLGIYINENPSGMSYRSDIGAADGAFNFSAPYVTPPIIGHFNTGSSMYFTDIPSDNWYSYTMTPPSSVLGLTEIKRFRAAYAPQTLNGTEVSGRRTTTATTLYNPTGTVSIGTVRATNWTAYSTNRYCAAYIASALSTIESTLMYVAVQRFNTTLGRHSGTGISPAINTYGTAPSLVSSGMKVNLDASALTPPAEGALTTALPGQYFTNSAVWTDSSGSGNHGTFRTSGDSRAAEYFVSDYSNAPEVRFREVGASFPKLYQSGYSPDALTTTYAGSDTGTFTFGGWIKVSSSFPSTWLVRGNDAYGGGWSLIFSAGLGSTVGFSAVAAGSGAYTATRAASTILQADTWYHAYLIWKPGSYVKIYLNGALEAQWTNTYSGLRSSSVGFGINSNVFGNTYGHGRTIVGAYHVYDRELTEAEIRQNFDAHKSRYNVLSAADADAQAFAVAANLSDSTQISAVNALVTSLKTAGIWTKMKAIYPFVGGTAQSHKFNLKDPRNADAAFRLTFAGGWTHSAAGALPSGTTGYADTKLNPSQSISNQFSGHLSLYSNTDSFSSTSIIGAYNYFPVKEFQIGYWKRSTGENTYYFGIGGNTNILVDTLSPTTKGFLLGSRTSSSAAKLYQNGTTLGSSSAQVVDGFPNASLYLGARNGSADGIAYQRLNHQFASIGDGLTDAEASSLYSAVQAFQTALGRQA